MRRLLAALVPVIAVVATAQAAPPPSTPTPGVAPKRPAVKPSLRSPVRFGGVRRPGAAPYVTGPLGVEIEVINESDKALATSLAGKDVRAAVAVPAKGRAWVPVTLPGGLGSGCNATTLPLALEDGSDRTTLKIVPSCTFTLKRTTAEDAATIDDAIDYGRANKVWINGGSAELANPVPRCGVSLVGNVQITNYGAVPATNVALVFDGNRSNVGTLPARERISRKAGFNAVFDGRHGTYELKPEASGVSTWGWVRYEVARSCTLALDLD